MGNSNTIILSKLAAWCLLLCPISHTYGIAGISLTNFLLAFLVFLTFLLKGFNLKGKLSIWFYIYIIYAWLNHAYYAPSFFGKIYYPIILSLLSYLCFANTIETTYLVRCYKKVVFISCIFFFLQEFSYYTTGMRISGIVPFIPTNIGEDDFMDVTQMAERSASFFHEPAAFAQYLLPLGAIILLKKRSLKETFLLILILITLLATRSGNALVGILLLSIFFIVWKLRNSNLTIKILIFSAVAFLVIPSAYVYTQSELGEALMEREEELDPEAGSGSGFLRIFRGYYTFDRLTTTEKIFGLFDFDKIVNRLYETGFASIENQTYMNNVQSILIKTGIIGAIIYVLFLNSLWRRNLISGKCIVYIFIGLSFIAHLYLTETMALYIITAFKLKEYNINYNKLKQIRLIKRRNLNGKNV